MKTITTVIDGIGGDCALTTNGWVACVLLIPEIRIGEEKPSPERMPSSDAEYHIMGNRRKLLCVTENDGVLTHEVVSIAERIRGPAVLGGETSVLAWIECDHEGNWKLCCKDGDDCARNVVKSRTALRSPDLARTSDGIRVCCEYFSNGRACAGIWDMDGRCVYSIEGRSPCLCGSSGDTLFLSVANADGAAVGRRLAILEKDRATGVFEFPRVNDCNLNPNMAWSDADRSLYVVWESCPAWRAGRDVGGFRDIALWRFSLEQMAFVAGEGTKNGIVPIPREAFKDVVSWNFVPVFPRFVAGSAGTEIVYRRFRFIGHKSFGWDSYVICLDGKGWELPDRVSPNAGPLVGGHALVFDGRRRIGFFSVCDYLPSADFDGTYRGAHPAENIRVEIVESEQSERQTQVCFPESHKADFVEPEGVHCTAGNPPSLSAEPSDFSLVWGDLHAHSAFSKCMSAGDGDPMDVLRYQRDVLGCAVLCLTEHVEYTSLTEFRYVMDCVEEMAGADCVPLYGMEKAPSESHHTNFYAIDREVAEELREILFAEHKLPGIFKTILRRLPHGSVIAVRHFHGGGVETRNVNLLPPVCQELEPAMEATQVRGNVMIEPFREGYPLFPANFLNAKARLGLVGGTDHVGNERCNPNRFCLTGMWVRDLTPQGVFECLRSRRTIACANGHVKVWTEFKGLSMGTESVAPEGIRITVRSSCATCLRQARLMGDARFLDVVELNGTEADFVLEDRSAEPGDHWYVVVIQAEGEHEPDSITAQTSPFFVKIEGK